MAKNRHPRKSAGTVARMDLRHAWAYNMPPAPARVPNQTPRCRIAVGGFCSECGVKHEVPA